jgi:hypothetical protein
MSATLEAARRRRRVTVWLGVNEENAPGDPVLREATASPRWGTSASVSATGFEDDCGARAPLPRLRRRDDPRRAASTDAAHPLPADDHLTKVRDMSTEPARDAIDTVRAFNRTVTSRIGALEDHYLGSDPLPTAVPACCGRWRPTAPTCAPS